MGSEKELIMRGMKVNDSYKRKGMSYLFISVWVILAGKLGIRNLRTKLIDKPLVAIVLEKFGFVPSNSNHVIKVGLNSTGVISIWSKNMKRLKSTFSKSYLKTQGMCIVEEEPSNSTTAHVRTEYIVSDKDGQKYNDALHALKKKAKKRIGTHNYWFFSARLLSFFHQSPWSSTNI